MQSLMNTKITALGRDFFLLLSGSSMFKTIHGESVDPVIEIQNTLTIVPWCTGDFPIVGGHCFSCQYAGPEDHRTHIAQSEDLIYLWRDNPVVSMTCEIHEFYHLLIRHRHGRIDRPNQPIDLCHLDLGGGADAIFENTYASRT